MQNGNKNEEKVKIISMLPKSWSKQKTTSDFSGIDQISNPYK